MAQQSSLSLGYSVFEFSRAVMRNAKVAGDSNIKYEDFLEYIRKQVQKNNSPELADAIGSEEGSDILRTVIAKFITLAPRIPAGFEMDALIDRIYKDMAGLGILEDLLTDPTVEEINYNGYEQGVLEVKRRSGTEFPDVNFPSADAALNTVRKMVRMGGGQLDYSNPIVDSYLDNGIRIQANTYPVLRKKDMVSFSIRLQNKKEMSREDMISFGTTTEEIIDFETCCLTNGISIALVGPTGSGKTADITFLANQFILKNKKTNSRVFLDDDSREVELITEDTLRQKPACVIYTATTKGPNPITHELLVQVAMRQHPALIIPTECRDKSAQDIADAGNTGHTILTSFHAKSAKEGYLKFLSMCLMKQTGMSENTLMQYIITAIPIMVYKEEVEDNTIKVMEVFEATGIVDGKVVGNTLFRYVKDGFEYDDDLNITKVNGHFEPVDNLSDERRFQMESKGGKEVKDLLDRIFPKEKKK